MPISETNYSALLVLYLTQHFRGLKGDKLSLISIPTSNCIVANENEN